LTVIVAIAVASIMTTVTTHPTAIMSTMTAAVHAVAAISIPISAAIVVLADIHGVAGRNQGRSFQDQTREACSSHQS
jgi:hypothetical protein